MVTSAAVEDVTFRAEIRMVSGLLFVPHIFDHLVGPNSRSEHASTQVTMVFSGYFIPWYLVLQVHRKYTTYLN